MWVWFSKLGSPKWFYELSGKWLPWLIAAMVIFMTIGLVWGLVFLPPDYQQGFTSRILIVHVAVAGTSLAFFPLMLVAGTITLVWRMKLADMVAKNAAILGAWFSFITLATGSLWGSVMWGTWWEWTDSRLVSMLFQLFLLLGGDLSAFRVGRFGDSGKGLRLTVYSGLHQRSDNQVFCRMVEYPTSGVQSRLPRSEQSKWASVLDSDFNYDRGCLSIPICKSDLVDTQ